METVDSDIDGGLATSLGVLKVDTDRGKSMYIGREHWHTVLSDISEVKNLFAEHRKELEESYEKALSTKSATGRETPTLATPASEVELRAEYPLPHRLSLDGVLSGILVGPQGRASEMACAEVLSGPTRSSGRAEVLGTAK